MKGRPTPWAEKHAAWLAEAMARPTVAPAKVPRFRNTDTREARPAKVRPIRRCANTPGVKPRSVPAPVRAVPVVRTATASAPRTLDLPAVVYVAAVERVTWDGNRWALREAV